MVGWLPWRAARDHETLVIEFGDLPDGTGAAWFRDESGDLIVLDRRLRRRARKGALAHELVHVERGIGWGAATSATMQVEERVVRRETARRLVPPGMLRRFVDRRVDCEPVTAGLVADEFDVPVEVAGLALELLRGW